MRSTGTRSYPPRSDKHWKVRHDPLVSINPGSDRTQVKKIRTRKYMGLEIVKIRNNQPPPQKQVLLENKDVYIKQTQKQAWTGKNKIRKVDGIDKRVVYLLRGQNKNKKRERSLYCYRLDRRFARDRARDLPCGTWPP